MSEYDTPIESIRSNDDNIVRLSRFVLFNLQFSAGLPLKDASERLISLSRNHSGHNLSLYSVAGYESTLDEFDKLRYGSSISDAEDRIENFFFGKDTREIYIDGHDYKVKQSGRGVSIAFAVKPDSRPLYREMLDSIGDISPALHRSEHFNTNSADYIYSTFMAGSSHERDFAVLSLKKTLKDLADRPPGFMSVRRPLLRVQPKLRRDIRPTES